MQEVCSTRNLLVPALRFAPASRLAHDAPHALRSRFRDCRAEESVTEPIDSFQSAPLHESTLIVVAEAQSLRPLREICCLRASLTAWSNPVGFSADCFLRSWRMKASRFLDSSRICSRSF